MRRGIYAAIGRRGIAQRHQRAFRSLALNLCAALAVVTICSLSLFSTIAPTRTPHGNDQFDLEKLWRTAPSDDWRPSSAPRTDWPSPPDVGNGFLRVRCNGGLNQQRTAATRLQFSSYRWVQKINFIPTICNAVVAARIMNATLVLPELDTNSFWHDESGFAGIYDVDHFMDSLRFDISIVKSLPEARVRGKVKQIKSYQLRPPRDASPSWYKTKALAKMKEFGAIYLTPFSHRLAEEIDDPELQRLRCRVNYHALRFKPHIMNLSQSIVRKLRAEGHFLSIHLRFEMDMLAFAGCLKIFTSEEQKILRDYRKKNFAEKELEYEVRRAMGKCPLTPEEVGLILSSMGFQNSTRIYIASGELFGGDRFMEPLKALFPRLENHSSVAGLEKLEENSRGLVGSAVDYMVCLLSDIFMPTYDGPSNFANNLMGHRLYYGFRSIILPDRKALAPIFIDREDGRTAGFEERIKRVMFRSKFGQPHKRVQPEFFYTNPWPECFCQMSATNPADKCPPENVLEILDSKLQLDEGSVAVPSTVSLRARYTTDEVR